MIINYFPSEYTPNGSQVYIANELDVFFASKKKFCIINAPTGTGKSFVSMMLANYANKVPLEVRKAVKNYSAYEEEAATEIYNKKQKFGAYILTITKSLQTQYERDFKDLRAFKGKSAYYCNLDGEKATVDVAPCSINRGLVKSCWACNKCDYYNARNDAMSTEYAVLNYHSFTSLMPWLKHRQFMICDEASEMEDIIVSMFTANISYKTLRKYGENIEVLTPNIDRLEWLMKLREILDGKIKELRPQMSKNATKAFITKLTYFTELESSVGNIIEYYHCADYIFQNVTDGIVIQPLKINKLAPTGLFNYADKVFLISATIIDHKKYAHDLGIAENDFHYIECPSAFDPKKGQIYIAKQFYMGAKTLDANLPKVVPVIDKLLDTKYKGVRGAIHTSTNKITKYLKDNLKQSRCSYREAGIATNEDLLAMHLDRDDSVIVSPSIGLGVDLKNDAARFQIIVKLSWPSLESDRNKYLLANDKEWYDNKTLSHFIQMCGRVVRNVNDYGETLCLDANAIDLLVRNRHKIPKYFLDRLV